MKKEEQSGGKESLKDLLQKRQELDQKLESKHTRELTIMFTDIKGSTGFQESHGDFAGRMKLEKHNQILSSFLKEYEGKYILSTGDGALVVFIHPEDGVNAAIGMQKELMDYNTGRNKNEQIHVRMALNYGKVIEDGGNVAGHAVSVTARIEAVMTEAGQIFISESVYEKVRNSEDIICRSVPSVKAKGVEEPLKLYRVVWNLEQEVVGGMTRGQVYEQPGVTRKRTVFVIDISKETEKIKISGYERVEGEHKTVRHYEEVKVDDKKIQNYNTEVISLLNRANQRGRVTKDIINKLKIAGQLLYDEIFSAEIKRKFATTHAEDMTISIDDHMVGIPWELLYDGNAFFCLRFNMGRLVRTRQPISETPQRRLELPLKMLILSDPRGNLKSAYHEGRNIRDKLDSLGATFNANIKSSNIKSSYILEKIRNFDILHYAGHSDYDPQNPELSGWLFKDGKFTASDIMKMKESKVMPSLVFANSCHSGQTSEWKISDNCENKIYGMANAFLLTGVQHYIGSFWEILDEPSSLFAATFYESLSKNNPIGEAVRHARLELINRYGEETIVWASYMLYGNPSFYYISASDGKDHEGEQPSAAETKPDPASLPGSGSRASNESISIMTNQTHAGALKWLYRSAGAAAGLVLMAFFLFQWNTVKKQSDLLERGLKQGSKQARGTQSLAIEERNAVLNKQKQQQIDTLVKDLVERYRAGKIEGEKKSLKDKKDNWSSRPLIVTLFPMKMKNSDNASDNKVILETVPNILAGSLAANNRIKLVDRTLMDKLLEELKLSGSELADPETALRIGKLVGARFIATGSVFSLGDELQVTMKMIETETTLIIESIIKTASGKDSLAAVVTEIAEELAESLKAKFPFKGNILSVENEKVIINIGRSLGITENLRFKILQERGIENSNRKIKVHVGAIEVSSVDDEVSTGIVISEKMDIAAGMKVVEILSAN